MRVWPYPFHSNQNPLVIPPGLLRTEIDIQAPSSDYAGSDEYGGPAEPWTSVLHAMAGVQYLSSSERFDRVQQVSVSTHRITLHWPGELGIVEGWRVVLVESGRLYTVQYPEDVEQRHRVLHLYCTQVNGKN